MTHSEEEIKKFDDLASDFWNIDGAFKMLHQMNPIRMAFIEKFIDLHQKSVVDIGCGGGILSEALAKKGASVDGIDLSQEGIAAAKAHQKISQSSVNYQVISSNDYLQLKQQTNPLLDAVFCLEMLEHVNNPQTIVDDCAKLVKPNGVVIFSTINRTLKAKLLAIFVAENILSLVPKGTHDYNLFIKPSEMLNMAEKSGLTPLDIQGIEYHPIKKELFASQNTDINYLFAFKKPF